MAHRSHARGLSLIELMVVLTVIGLMLMLAIPGFGNWMQN
jgi:prepilin-type N-terminal cleavage/methylation domain-containing protein